MKEVSSGLLRNAVEVPDGVFVQPLVPVSYTHLTLPTK
jgi:hypothetical protein